MKVTAAIIGFLILTTAPSASTQAPGGSIEGTVLRANTSEPLAGIFVSLEAGYGRIRTIETDADGHFSFKNLASADYTIEPWRDGYFAVTAVTNREIHLGVNEHVRDVTGRMERASTLSGRILYSDGEPVVGTEVVACEPGYAPGGEPECTPVESAKTDDRGEYRIFWLAPGDYYVATDYVPATAGMGPAPHRTFYPGTREQSSAASVHVNARADIAAIDFTVIEPPSRPLFTISGNVVGLPAGFEDKPVETFQLVPPGATPLPYNRVIRNAAADRSNGRFVLRGILPGSYEIYPVVKDSANRRYTQLTPVTVVDRSVENLTIEVRPGVDVRGRIVVDEENRDVLRGNPQISLRSKHDDTYWWDDKRQVDPNSGAFVLHNIFPGQYELQYNTALPPDCYLKDVRQGGRSVFDGFTVGGESPEPLDVIIGSDGGIVDGVVSGDNHVPVNGATILMLPAQSLSTRSNQYFFAESGKDGSFRIFGVRPGDYKIYAWIHAPRFAYRNAEFRRRYEQRGTPISVKAGLATAVSLRGILVEP